MEKPPTYEDSLRDSVETKPNMPPSSPVVVPVVQPIPAPQPIPVHVHQPSMSNSNDTDKIIEILLILFFPPLAVWYHARACNCHVCLNIFLLCLFVLPAYIHAIWYCYMRDRSVGSA